MLHSAEARTEEYAHINEISESTHGILFMGTPHQGSAHASWGGMLASILGFVKQDNVGIVQGLEKEAPHLAELQKRFYTFLANRKQEGSAINITCFNEELPVAVLGTVC